MRLISYILVLLLGTCWLLSVQDGLVCGDRSAVCKSDFIDSVELMTSNLASPHEHGHDLDACHFGHCGHMISKVNPFEDRVPANFSISKLSSGLGIEPAVTLRPSRLAV